VTLRELALVLALRKRFARNSELFASELARMPLRDKQLHIIRRRVMKLVKDAQELGRLEAMRPRPR
jgi:hypothetical protein